MIEARIRTKISDEELELKKGMILKPDDINLMITGPARVLKPDGQPLCVYLPGAISSDLKDLTWEILHSFKERYTDNRGLASGTPRMETGQRPDGTEARSRAMEVSSSIVGSFEASGPKQFCRLTAWTGRENEQWQTLWPLFQYIGQQFKEHVPDRYANQLQAAAETSPEWVIPGTVFTTITINNTYPTGVHQDKGDLDSGFSTLAVFRNGEYEGGWICFPEYRVGVDMKDGDLLLMDAHAWHGNTRMLPEPKRNWRGYLQEDPGYERISVVSYFRTRMIHCGNAADEAERARINAENRSAALLGE